MSSDAATPSNKETEASDSFQSKSDDVYDRQIRLWGADAQSKISLAKILYIHITGVSSEILKNLVLAGVKPVICDGRPYPDAVAETPSSFFSPCISQPQTPLTVARAIKPQVEELNPILPSCRIEERNVEDLPDEYFHEFDVVIASNLGMTQCLRIAQATVNSDGRFFMVDTFGLSGCAFIDLGSNHSYRKEIGKDKLSDWMKLPVYAPLQQIFQKKLCDAVDRWNRIPPKILIEYRSILQYENETGMWPSHLHSDDFVKRTLAFLQTNNFDDALLEQYWGENQQQEESLKSLASLASAQVSPVCAVLGGIIGNEVIKVLSGKGQPANNVLMFDGMEGGCRAFLIT